MAKAKGKKFTATVKQSASGSSFRETNPMGVKPPGSFAPTPECPIPQRKRMGGIN